jgi:hypothetical protein
MKERYGRWRYDAERIVLVYVGDEGRDEYEVDPEECTTSAETLDRIAQVSKKTWASREDVGYLVQALDDLLDFQANLCSFGDDKRITDVRGLIERRSG